MDRFVSIQILRAVAALSVLLSHVKLPLYEVYGWGGLGPIFDSLLGAIGVDIFFVVSGFVIALTADKKNHTPKAFALNRFIRVVPIYYVYTIPFAIYFILNGNISTASTFNSTLFLPLLDIGEFSNPFHSYGWTLSFEVWFYVMFTFILFFAGRSAFTVMPAVILALMPLSYFSAQQDWFFLSFAFHPMTGEFALGCLAYLIYKSGWLQPRLGAIFTLSAIILIFTVSLAYEDLAWHEQILSDFQQGLHRFIYWGLPSFVLLLGLLALEPFLQTAKLKGLCYLGDISYSLYLVQPFIFKFIEIVAPKISMPSIYWALLAIPGGIAAGAASYEIVEKPLMRYMRARMLYPATKSKHPERPTCTPT
ncbi:MAG: acyltransferase family protein [Pontibacterium sp.]